MDNLQVSAIAFVITSTILNAAEYCSLLATIIVMQASKTSELLLKTAMIVLLCTIKLHIYWLAMFIRQIATQDRAIKKITTSSEQVSGEDNSCNVMIVHGAVQKMFKRGNDFPTGSVQENDPKCSSQMVIA